MFISAGSPISDHNVNNAMISEDRHIKKRKTFSLFYIFFRHSFFSVFILSY